MTLHLGWLPTHDDDHADIVTDGTAHRHTAAAVCTCGDSSGVRDSTTSALGWIAEHTADPT